MPLEAAGVIGAIAELARDAIATQKAEVKVEE